MHHYTFSPVHTHTFPYSYKVMERDIASLQQLYPDILHTEVFSCSTQGRALYDIILGNVHAPHTLLVQAGIHGREWLNCLLVMMQVSALCQCMNGRKKFFYKGLSYGRLFSQVCVHILPMTNPDGVTISQQKNPLWKANARGVNLNSNFLAGFDSLPSSKFPHYKDYKGPSCHSETESRALVNLTKALCPDAVISYHETGSLIYFNYGQQGTLKKRCNHLAHAIAGVSGYPLDPVCAVSGGYSDWCVRCLHIPACTIETGSGRAPLGYGQLLSIWQQNRLVIPAAAAFSIHSSAGGEAAFPAP